MKVSATQKESSKELYLSLTLILLAFGALFDAFYLTIKHYSKQLPTCSSGIFADCGTVLTSQYATIFSIPISLLGLLHYGLLTILILFTVLSRKLIATKLIFLMTSVGLVFSIYLVSLQVFVIRSFCQYCMLSALISLLLYIVVRMRFSEEYHAFMPKKIEMLYHVFGKPAFFLFDPEWVHDNAMRFGELFGRFPFVKNIFSYLFSFEHKSLKQQIEGIPFQNPIGLAAGYDYEAAFTQILPSVGFGFETVGTITSKPNEGNKKPRLGRLIRSKSLLVNKGFRNPGAKNIVEKLEGKQFEFPLGISVGVTNDSKIKTLSDAIENIVTAFKTFDTSKVKHSYYELNISCPNLQTKVSFYDSKGLHQLLLAIGKLQIKKPVFIKMPIEKPNADVKKMLDEIVKHKYITGVIFGNLQKNKKDPALLQEEVVKAGKGNFSGKPTFKRSNELISLAYKQYGKKLVIIGCGGVFSAEDAYTKIKLGASLVQLITGMIFQGPQLITQIKRGLVKKLEQDGYKKLSDAVGVDT